MGDFLEWSREPESDDERALRETYLAFAVSRGWEGLVEVVLTARVFRADTGTLARDIASAEEYAVDKLSEMLGDAAPMLLEAQAYLAQRDHFVG
jgi:hypothetical protein